MYAQVVTSLYGVIGSLLAVTPDHSLIPAIAMTENLTQTANSEQKSP